MDHIEKMSILILPTLIIKLTLFRCSCTPVFTLYMDVSHILVMFVHHGSVDFRQGTFVLNCLCGEILFLIERGYRARYWNRYGLVGVFFFLFRPVGLFTNIRLLARETIPGPERKKNEVAFRWWILAVCFIRTPIEGWIDHSDKLALLRLQIQASSNETMLSVPYFLSDKM